MNIFNLLFKKSKRRRVSALSSSDRMLIRNEWRDIEHLLELNDPSGRKEALIRADKVLDLVLKRISSGETTGERLKNARDLFSNWQTYDGLWKAHKMRNAMVHEAGFEPPHYVIRTAIEQIKTGLTDLGVSALN